MIHSKPRMSISICRQVIEMLKISIQNSKWYFLLHSNQYFKLKYHQTIGIRSVSVLTDSHPKIFHLCIVVFVIISLFVFISWHWVYNCSVMSHEQLNVQDKPGIIIHLSQNGNMVFKYANGKKYSKLQFLFSSQPSVMSTSCRKLFSVLSWLFM